MNEDKNSWMGKKGFDEAYYYEDKKSDIGLTYSDETILAKITESLERNLPDSKFEVTSEDGYVRIKGPDEEVEERVVKLVKDISGVKSVSFSTYS